VKKKSRMDQKNPKSSENSLQMEAIDKCFGGLTEEQKIYLIRKLMYSANIDSVIRNSRSFVPETKEDLTPEQVNEKRLRLLFEDWFYKFAYVDMHLCRNELLNICYLTTMFLLRYYQFENVVDEFRGFESTRCFARVFHSDHPLDACNLSFDQRLLANDFLDTQYTCPKSVFIMCYEPEGRGFIYISMGNFFLNVDRLNINPLWVNVLWYFLGFLGEKDIDRNFEPDMASDIRESINHAWYRSNSPPSPTAIDENGKFNYTNENGIVCRATKWELLMEMFPGMEASDGNNFDETFEPPVHEFPIGMHPAFAVVDN
jgi:hypothetical protein